ncbi:hypothetical protein [Pseudomonas sp. 34 E 7]|nr:hypothetical protein [Pseudomonas sp. 34 E 7]
MHGAGVLQHLPLLRPQPGAVTQHQGRQGGLMGLRIGGHQALTQTVAQGVAGRREALAVFHRARGPNALRQQPGLVVDAMKIEQPGRPLEGDSQAPSLPTAHRRPAVPGHPDALGQPGLARPAVGQFKAHAGVRLLRQPDHTPLHPTRLAVQRRAQSVIQCPLRADAGPAHAQQEKRQRIGAKRQ